MKQLAKRSLLVATMGLLALPIIAFAADGDPAWLDTAITIGYYASFLGFLVATILMAKAVGSFGRSILSFVFSYLLTGTGIFLVITVFQTLGNDFFGIAAESAQVSIVTGLAGCKERW